ncbi:MAG: protease [Candidatus Latescibacteria bacterium]|nr:protease [Candidatus Latescibacterota bacterium]
MTDTTTAGLESGSKTAAARLLRQPTLSAAQVAFAYGGDLWIADGTGGPARRLTSTPTVESHPHFSPDGQWLAFTSDRSGVASVYVVAASGGTPQRLTWYPAGSYVRGWTPDGRSILYASSRETAPANYHRLWTVSPQGGPSHRIAAPWANDGSYSDDGGRIVVDRMARWDSEWRHYRGGQNTPLTILDLESLSETILPSQRSTDTQPVWLDQTIYFLSDRNWAVNIFAYHLQTNQVEQLTHFDDIDIKSLCGHGRRLLFERDGFLHLMDLGNRGTEQLEITVSGDFPWAEPRWQDVGDRVRSASLSPTGKRALFEARGEIFTVPVEKGDTRNLTRSPGVAERAPIWSPKGDQIAWFSDSGGAYALTIAAQDGLTQPQSIPIGESKMAWEPTWSPDGKRIAFIDDDARVRVVDLASAAITTIDSGGSNLDRGAMQPTWSPDSKWLAYAKTFANNLRRIVVCAAGESAPQPLTDPMADAIAPAWDAGGKHLFFLASTDLALASGWANTSQMNTAPTYGVYAVVLNGADATPFAPESDEESSDEEEGAGKEKNDQNSKEKDGDNKKQQAQPVAVEIDWTAIERRIVPLPMPVKRYCFTLTGPTGILFVGEQVGDAHSQTVTLQKFTLEDRKAKAFAEKVSRVAVSADGQWLLYQNDKKWQVVETKGDKAEKAKTLKVSLSMHLDQTAEWQQIFDEAWRYQRDYFYDPGLHGRDWDEVRRRYEPLLPHVRHRADLNYILDQMNGELSVGHSFVSGGDMPKVESNRVGLLGADLEADQGGWRIARIYTFESWNPAIKAPLDRPGLKVQEGHYLVGVDGRELDANDDPYRLLDGTVDRQTVLHINDQPSMAGAWTATTEPIKDEGTLRQRAWVEDNRRRVDQLSGGKLAYVWVPNTGQPGVISFNRYFFAQQDKWGAVIDERFNQGGLLDDYMVDLMTRSLRAAITNEVPEGKPFRLPAGILGPKVLLINELAGSGGDFFPWVFRQQQAGPLIGTRTWGGLVKSSVHYSLIDGGTITAPDNAVFDPVARSWIGENEGVPPDIEVFLDAQSVAQGRDPQLERGVQELLEILQQQPPPEVAPPAFPRPTARRRD